MFAVVEKVEDKAIDFMAAHPKIIGATTALALSGTGIVACAEGEESTGSSSSIIDTIVAKMGTELGGVAEKVIPAAVGVGVIFVAASLAWRWFKRMAYN